MTAQPRRAKDAAGVVKEPVKGDELQESQATTEPAPAPSNKRTRPRMELQVPMFARWRTDREHEVMVVSHDLNECGVFFKSDVDIPVGTRIELTFAMPADVEAQGNKRLRCEGTVVRVEHATLKTGYGVKIDSSEVIVPKLPKAGIARFITPEEQRAREHRRHVVLLVFLIAVLVVVLTSAIARISERKSAQAAQAAASQNVKVWVDTRMSVYYCPGSEFYGKTKAGKYMTQKQAQYDGFQPAFGTTCTAAASNPAR